MGNESRDYLSLPLVEPHSEDSQNDSIDSFLHPDLESRKPRAASWISNLSRREWWLVLIVFVQALFILVMGFHRATNAQKPISCRSPETSLLYSPAQETVEYEVKSFTAGRQHKTIYQGLSDEADKAWGALYNHTIVKIPKSQAALLPNKTYPIQGQPGYYMGMLDVFHQLHCLNMIRIALHPEYYPEKDQPDEEHVSHCVDTIRQSLMCNADISVNVWQWNHETSMVVGYSTQAHTCKKFDKLVEWALERRIQNWIDPTVFVEDDLPTPAVIY